MASPHTTVTCAFTFEAAHHLPWHPGRCRAVHGHSYRLEVTVGGPVNEQGVVLDFDDVRQVVERQVVGPWDHSDLNTVLDNPTAELLAARAWELLEAANLPLERLRLWETPRAWVELVARH
ncbi:MAG: 6-carboxytetrahydropterin synthase [Actinomycetota bacterium]|nr:6-carboxytetrahydropterin synthase [Actinomycetota bacterium]